MIKYQYIDLLSDYQHMHLFVNLHNNMTYPMIQTYDNDICLWTIWNNITTAYTFRHPDIITFYLFLTDNLYLYKSANMFIYKQHTCGNILNQIQLRLYKTSNKFDGTLKTLPYLNYQGKSYDINNLSLINLFNNQLKLYEENIKCL